MDYNAEIISGSLQMIEENTVLRGKNQELKKEISELEKYNEQLIADNNMFRTLLDENNDSIKELMQRESYYKALAEKYEEMLENPNRNYD